MKIFLECYNSKFIRSIQKAGKKHAKFFKHLLLIILFYYYFNNLCYYF